MAYREVTMARSQGSPAAVAEGHAKEADRRGAGPRSKGGPAANGAGAEMRAVGARLDVVGFRAASSKRAGSCLLWRTGNQAMNGRCRRSRGSYGSRPEVARPSSRHFAAWGS